MISREDAAYLDGFACSAKNVAHLDEARARQGLRWLVTHKAVWEQDLVTWSWQNGWAEGYLVAFGF